MPHEEPLSEHDHTQPGAPDQEAALAQVAFAQGDLPHAVFHLGVALAHDCTHPEWLALLDRIIVTADEPLALVPVSEGEVHYATAAIHAYTLANMGNKAAALDLLLQVVVALPVDGETTYLPYLDWAIAWAGDPAMIPNYPMSRIVTVLAWMLEQFPGLILHRAAERSVLQQIWLLVRKVPVDVPRNAWFHYGHASLLRKLGWLTEAISVAEKGYQEFPNYQTAMAMAMAYEAKEEHDAWLEYVRIAVTMNPDDLATRLDVADKLWNLDRKEEAAAGYDEVLQKQPEQPWAKAALLALRYEMTDDTSALAELRVYAASHPDESRVSRLLQKYMPYLGFLPEPAEDTVRIFTEFFENFAGPPSDETHVARIALPTLEAPSARLVGDLQIRALGWPLEFRFATEQIPQPDPRQPMATVAYKLWEWWDTTPLPAVPPPSVEISETIKDFAFSPYRLDVWLGKARHLASQLTRDDLSHLLGVMAHPPDLPHGVPGWLWVQHVQIAAALTIAWLEEDQPWEDSLRRRVLFDLALGPQDWTVSAAIIALMGIAQADAARQEEVFRFYLELLRHIPDEGYVCYLHPLLCCALYLPVGAADLRQELIRWKEMLEGTTEDTTEEVPPAA